VAFDWQSLVRERIPEVVLSDYGLMPITAQNNSANNLGAVAEQTVGTPSDGNFNGKVNSAVQPKVSAINSAMSVEPCSANYDGSVTPCVFQGYVNYLPYAPCN
jgi:hypothetical protein